MNETRRYEIQRQRVFGIGTAVELSTWTGVGIPVGGCEWFRTCMCRDGRDVVWQSEVDYS